MKNLAAALIIAQNNMPALLRTEDNPFFKSKYADLAQVQAACIPYLGEQGIAVLQSAGNHEDSVLVSITFVHADSGETWTSDLAMTPDKNTPQALGSTITYARRYLLATMAGLAPQDDDGNAASGTLANPAPPPRQKQQAPPPRNQVTPPQAGDEFATWLDWQGIMVTLDDRGDRASDGLYGVVKGCITAHTNDKEAYTEILSSILSRDVSTENPPSKAFCLEFLRSMSPTRSKKDAQGKFTQEKEQNPEYCQHLVDEMIELHTFLVATKV